MMLVIFLTTAGNGGMNGIYDQIVALQWVCMYVCMYCMYGHMYTLTTPACMRRAPVWFYFRMSRSAPCCTCSLPASFMGMLCFTRFPVPGHIPDPARNRQLRRGPRPRDSVWRLRWWLLHLHLEYSPPSTFDTTTSSTHGIAPHCRSLWCRPSIRCVRTAMKAM